MAYADKLTTMRRMALIVPNHNIIWEGVNIEGTCLLKRVDTIGVRVAVIDEDELEDLCESDLYNDEPLEVKYQDDKGENHWEPRMVKEREINEGKDETEI